MLSNDARNLARDVLYHVAIRTSDFFADIAYRVAGRPRGYPEPDEETKARLRRYLDEMSQGRQVQ